MTIEPNIVLSAEELNDKLNQFLLTRDVSLRNELVLDYSFVVKNVAKSTRGYYANYATFDDIVSQGIITLIDCLEKYDRSKNMEFEPYAFVRIRNATIDYIRKSDFLPRRVRQRAKQINQAHTDLSHELMREPTDVELAQYLDMGVDELSRHYGEVANANLLSMEEIEAFVGNEDGMDFESSGTSTDPKQIFDQKVMQGLLKEAIDSLPEREQIIVSLYYYENLKLKEIAEVLDVTEARVSQLHSKILLKLKDYMQGTQEV